MTTVATNRLTRLTAFLKGEVLFFDPAGGAWEALEADYARMLAADMPEIKIADELLKAYSLLLQLEFLTDLLSPFTQD